VVREAIEERGGYVFSMAGDAFSAAFSQVPLAVAAAATAQRGLQKLEVAGAPLRVRMAVHVGNAQERDGDYFGPVLNRCTRLMAAAAGHRVAGLEEVRVQPPVEVEAGPGAEARSSSLGIPQHVVTEVVDFARSVERIGADPTRCRAATVRIHQSPVCRDGQIAEYLLEFSGTVSSVARPPANEVTTCPASRESSRTGWNSEWPMPLAAMTMRPMMSMRMRTQMGRRLRTR